MSVSATASSPVVEVKHAAPSAAPERKRAVSTEVRIQSLKELLESTTVASFTAATRGAAGRTMITLESTEPPMSAFQKLIDAQVQSAPVREVGTGRWVGFLDLRDLVSYVILCYEFELKKATEAERAREASAELHELPDSPAFLHRVLANEHATDKATMHRDPRKGITTKYLAVRNRFVPVHPEDSMYRAAQLLGSSEIHRVPVVDREGRLVDIISQSNLIKFFSDNATRLASTLSATLTELGLATKPVLHVLDSDTTLSAFQLMNSKHLSGLAVVNAAGVTVANTSASDLKLFMAKPSFRLLRMPVFQYLNIIRRASMREGAPVVSVHPDDSLAKAIGKLSATGLHRVFVVDPASKPIGVLSLTDILRLCTSPTVLPAPHPPSPAVAPAAAPAEPPSVAL